MQLQSAGAQAQRYYQAAAGNFARATQAPDLDAFKAHLELTGKICLKPWCWKRFFMLYKPAAEPPWLSAWWLTSTQQKKDLFLQQVEYLAIHTNQFHAACRFLYELDNEYWLMAQRK